MRGLNKTGLVGARLARDGEPSSAIAGKPRSYRGALHLTYPTGEDWPWICSDCNRYDPLPGQDRENSGSTSGS
ncbi:hypothetical protein EMIT0P176_100102 [Pseudomonas sp. IT-P176]